jgi:hypothetical protein
MEKILTYQNYTQNNFLQRTSMMGQELDGELDSKKHGTHYFSPLQFYEFTNTVKKLNNSENLNYFTGIDNNKNSQFIYEKIQKNIAHLDSGKKINIMALDQNAFHYVNYEIFKNKNNEIEIRIYNSLKKLTKENQKENQNTGDMLLSGIKNNLSFGSLDEGIKKRLKFSIGRCPQQTMNNFNCGEHSFTNNSLKDLLKMNKELLTCFPLIKYTDMQDGKNFIVKFFIRIIICMRKFFLNESFEYKENTHRMFKLIKVIAQISIFEQNANFILKSLSIKNIDILKYFPDLKKSILLEVTNEFKNHKNDRCTQRIEGKLYQLFENKVNLIIKENNIQLNEENKEKLNSMLRTLEKQNKDCSNKIINNNLTLKDILDVQITQEDVKNIQRNKPPVNEQIPTILQGFITIIDDMNSKNL